MSAPAVDQKSQINQESQVEHHESDPEFLQTPAPKAATGMKELFSNKRILGWCLLIFILPINFGYEIALVGNTRIITPWSIRPCS